MGRLVGLAAHALAPQRSHRNLSCLFFVFVFCFALSFVCVYPAKVNSSIANLNRPLMEESITDVSLIGSSVSGSMPIRAERPASPFTRLAVPTTHSYRRSSPHLGPGFLEGSNDSVHGSVH